MLRFSRRMLCSPATTALCHRRACLSPLEQTRFLPLRASSARSISPAIPAAMSSSSSSHHHRFSDAEMETAAAELVPPLEGSRRKGQAGRVAVIGGCREYTGAPYFAAMAALRTGADLAHVFCTRGAAPIIKAYSPDLIVHPLLRESVDRNSSGENDGEEKRAAAGTKATTSSSSPSSSSALAALSVSDIEPWLPRFDSLVVGPGLGSDPAIEEAALTLMTRARELGIALLLDADALKLVSRDPGSVRGYRGAVVTPNAVEFERMARSLGLVEKEKDNEEKEKGSASSSLRFDAAAFAGGPSSSSSSSSSLPDSPLDSVAALALALDGPVVVRKGAGDCMAVAVSSSSRSDSGGGEEEEEQKGSKNQPSSPPPPPPPPLIFSACCSHGGSPRRAGGQGDLTSGSVAAFLAWACSRRLAAGGGGGGGGGGGNDEEEEKKGSKLHSPPAALAAAFGGCSLVRGAAAAAFARRRRAALASDVLDAIEGAEEAAPPRGFDV